MAGFFGSPLIPDIVFRAEDAIESGNIDRFQRALSICGSVMRQGRPQLDQARNTGLAL